MPTDYRLKGRLVLTGKIVCVTGLHIGGSQEGVDIGGLDAPVVRIEYLPPELIPEAPRESCQGGEARLRIPYIPGSSLRGKMRSLLEWYEGKVATTGPAGAHQCGSVDEAIGCPVCRVFGIAAREGEDWERLGPTRLRVEDAYPTWRTLDQLAAHYGEEVYTEVKWENYLNRLTSMANPRQIERVPAGAVFAFRFVYDVLDGDGIEPPDEQMFDQAVLLAMRLLEDSTLGGHGSRGYGRIKFQDLKLVWRPREFYEGKGDPKQIARSNTVTELASDFQSKVSELVGG